MRKSSTPPVLSPKPRKKKSRWLSFKVLVSSAAAAIGFLAVLLGNIDSIAKFFGQWRNDSGISLIVSVADLKPPPQEENAIDIAYRQEVRDGWLEITPDGKYFEVLKNGGPLPTNWCRGDFLNVAPAGLDLRLVNNSGKVIVPHEITLEVAKSRPDNSPLLYVVENPSDLMSVSFNNEGWGEITEMDITYALAPATSSAGATIDLPYHVRVKPPEDGLWQFSIADALIREGASETLTRRLQTLESQRRANPDADYEAVEPLLKQLRGNGEAWNTRFGLRDPAVEGIRVTGRARCTWRDYDNSLKTQEVTFRALANLTIPDGLGAVGLEPAAQVGFELPIQADNIRLSKPLSRVLSGADADRYTVTLFSKQSAVHEFRLRVRYDAEHEAVSGWIRYHFLLPTSMAALKQESFAPAGDR